MPSRPQPSSPPQPLSTAAPPLSLSPQLHHNHHHKILLIGSLSVAILLLSLLLLTLLTFLYRKLSFQRTTPFPHHSHNHNHRRFSYSLLRRATNSFSPSTKLGHGGFGSVHKATLPSGETVALKLMDSPGSLQGEREFHNELTLCSNLNSPFILSLLGFSSDRYNRKLILVYELMKNRSLQDALLDRKCPELMNWKTRFDVVVSVAKGLQYLHHECEPPVIHGDIKPSNILLDCEFRAKIGDFGLARVKEEVGVVVVEEEGGGGSGCGGEECDRGSVVEEAESVATGTTVGFDLERSPESFSAARVFDSDASPAGAAGASPELEKGSVLSESCFDGVSVESGNQRRKGGGGGGGGGGGSYGRDWWWKQDNGGGSESGRVKDYVMEWIGSEIKKERPKSEWVASPSSIGCDAVNHGDDGGLDSEGKNKNKNKSKINKKKKKKKQRKRLDWWASLDEEKAKKEKNRKPREWWKEEFCDELTKKSKKKKRSLDNNGGESWWQKDEDLVVQDQKKKRKSKSSRGSIDWWLDGLSGELRNNIGRRNSQDWVSGDIPKSGGISSTPSMRGTVCYIAPEYGGGGQLSEKCDVYSFGVLLLVLVAGRRPLQVTASPISEFERANLISWARQLAHNGRLLDLVDPSIHSLDKEQALLCITIALLCLQRSPGKRPSMKEIVGMLSGEAETPHLPFEFSPSPPSNFLFKSRKKAR